MKKLVIAEKPSVAQTVAKALGVTGKGNGCIEGDDYIITWCYGHMLTIKDDPRFKAWRIEDLPIIPEKWEYEPAKGAYEQLRIIKGLIARKDVGSIVCATDAGREGELIFRLVYNDSKTKKPAERLWVSSLEEQSVREGFEHLKPSSEYDNLYHAALARSEADWLVGINATRFYSVVFRSPDGKALTVGRVQTPTLQMIIDREQQIKDFQSKESWQVAKIFDGWTLQSERYEKEADAENAKRLTDGKPVTIKAVEEKDRKQSPPLLYSLTSLQQDANRILGYSADETLRIAQDLYEKKMLSYPRTDAEYITADMEKTFVDVVQRIRDTFYPELEFRGAKRLVDDSKVSDHYALMLTRHFAETNEKTGTKGFSNEEKAIIRLVGKRMMQAVSPWHEWHETKVTGESEGIEFSGTGRREMVLGWTAVGKRKDAVDEEPKADKKSAEASDDAGVFPSDMRVGAVYMPLDSEIRKRKTKPPRPYTEDTLLGAMEKAGSKDMPDDAERKGLGTSATRASIIEGLVNKGYIVREKRKKGAAFLRPTDKAYYLVSIVQNELKDAKMTAEWEWRLKSIEKGKDTLPSFISDIEKSVRALIKEGMESPEAAAAEADRNGVFVGVCPFCRAAVLARGRTAECTNPECGTKVWRETKALNGHTLTDSDLKKLFQGEWVVMKLFSAKTRKPYTAAVRIKDEPYIYTDKTGREQRNFAFEFSFDPALTGVKRKKDGGAGQG